MNFDQYLDGIAKNIKAARSLAHGDGLTMTDQERAHRMLIVTKKLEMEIQKIEAVLVLLKRNASVDVQIKANDLLIRLKELHTTLTKLRLELNMEWL